MISIQGTLTLGPYLNGAINTINLTINLPQPNLNAIGTKY